MMVEMTENSNLLSTGLEPYSIPWVIFHEVTPNLPYQESDKELSFTQSQFMNMSMI